MELYVRLNDPSNCPQVKYGKTPCFNQMTKDGVDCDLCPVRLHTEKLAANVVRMFHDGTCLMDERNSANMGAIAKYRTTGKRQKAIPVGLKQSQIIPQKDLP